MLLRVLIVAATEAEVMPFCKAYGVAASRQQIVSVETKCFQVDVLISGVGIVAALHATTLQIRAEKYMLVVNAGIAGAFNRSLPVGEVVRVMSDEFADIGVETDAGLQTLFDMGFAQPNERPFRNGKIEAKIGTNSLRPVSGITVAGCSGTAQTVAFRQQRYAADIETMEGAAVLYACAMADVPCEQIRGISNYVEVRNKEAWDIPVAIANLNSVLLSSI